MREPVFCCEPPPLAQPCHAPNECLERDSGIGHVCELSSVGVTAQVDLSGILSIGQAGGKGLVTYTGADAVRDVEELEPRDIHEPEEVYRRVDLMFVSSTYYLMVPFILEANKVAPDNAQNSE